VTILAFSVIGLIMRTVVMPFHLSMIPALVAHMLLFALIVCFLWPGAWKSLLRSTPPPLLSFFSSQSGHLWPMMAIVLALDLSYLLSGAFLANGNMIGAKLDFHPTLWGSNAASIFFAVKIREEKSSPASVLLTYLVLWVHLVMVLLGYDIYSARLLVLVLTCFSLLFSRFVWTRIFSIFFALIYLATEQYVTGTRIFESLYVLDWLCPLSGAALIYDMTLKAAAFYSSGDWGLGLEYLRKMDFAEPTNFILNGLSNFTVVFGYYGLLIYAFLIISVVLLLGWALMKKVGLNSGLIILPMWFMALINQYSTLAVFLAFRSYGLTHGPAFVGGVEPGLEIIILFILIYDPASVAPAASNSTDRLVDLTKSSEAKLEEDPAPPGDGEAVMTKI
jgi:hypothetical protein